MAEGRRCAEFVMLLEIFVTIPSLVMAEIAWCVRFCGRADMPSRAVRGFNRCGWAPLQTRRAPTRYAAWHRTKPPLACVRRLGG